MTRIRFALVLLTLVACGGGTPDSVTAGSHRPDAPVPTAAATATAAPTTSASATPPTQTAAAPPHALAADVPSLDVLDAPARIAQLYGGATVARDARVRTLKDFATKWKADFASLARAPREQAAMTWLRARPEIEDAGVAQSSVWARFKDGKLVLVPTYEWRKPTTARHAVREVERGWNGKADVPANKAMATPEWFGFPEHGVVVSWLSEHGYAPTNATPSVASLRASVKGAGIFYIDTHGGDGLERNLHTAAEQGDYDQIYALMTSTPVLDMDGKPIKGPSASGVQLGDLHSTPNDQSQMEDDLSHGALVYFYADLGDGNLGWMYAFTHRFVAKYFSLSDNAFVFLNACDSHGATSGAMISAFMKKGAALVVGWTKEVSPTTAMRADEFLFDRMLGENKMSDDGLQADKPKQRPWSFGNAFADLQSKNYDHEINPKGEPNSLQYTGDTSVVLVPIIDKVEADDLKQVLTLHGTFGDDPADKDRHVKIGGQDCPIKDWSGAQITCDLGQDFKKGDVVVEKQSRKSNPTPLTAWNIRVKYKLDTTIPGQFGLGVGFEAHVRGDVHKVRDTPSAQPKDRDPVPFYAAMDSKCGSANDVGSFSANGGHAWMAGGKSIPLLHGPPSGSEWCIMYGQIDPQNKQLKLAVFAITARSAGTFDITGPNVNRSVGMALGTIPAPGLFDGAVTPPPGVPPNAAMPTAIYFSLDDKGTISSGKKGPVTLGSSGKMKVSLEWDSVQAEDFPSDDTPQ